MNPKMKYNTKKRFVNFIYFFLGLIIVVFVQNYNLSAAQTDSKKEEVNKKKKSLSLEEISKIWTKIRTAAPPKNAKIEKGSADAWVDIIHVGHRELKKIVMSSNPRQGLEYFVNQFGKDGPQADMRWLISARSMMLTANRTGRPYYDKKDFQLRRAQLIFAELQVRQFLKSPKLLDHYYHSVIWFNHMFADTFFPAYLGNVVRNMQEDTNNNDEYWWYAQNFVLMVHATGRDDLLKNANPEDLKPQFKEWFEWFKKNGMYLRPSSNSISWDIDKGEKRRKEGYVPFLLKHQLPPLKLQPKYPFSNWKGLKPATPQEYRTME